MPVVSYRVIAFVQFGVAVCSEPPLDLIRYPKVFGRTMLPVHLHLNSLRYWKRLRDAGGLVDDGSPHYALLEHQITQVRTTHIELIYENAA